MKNVNIESFQVIGIKVRTTNENGRAGKDIVALWNTFMSEGVLNKIPAKLSTAIYSIYTNYESDYTKPYDTLLGCKVSSLDNIPEGMVGQSFARGTYANFTAQGDLSKGIVYAKWVEIWKTDLDRLYIADFEIYDEKTQNPLDAAVSIYVGVKNEYL